MKIDQDSVPSTIKSAVDQIISSLDQKDINFIKHNPSYTVHHGTGMHIRNAWSLWELDTPLKRDAVNTYGIAHADDISGLIFEWVWANVRGEEFDPHEHVKIYHNHWEGLGMTALKAGGWKE